MSRSGFCRWAPATCWPATSGCPSPLDAALAVALTGTGQPIDSGTANGRSFVVMAGLGLDARMLQRHQ